MPRPRRIPSSLRVEQRMAEDVVRQLVAEDDGELVVAAQETRASPVVITTVRPVAKALTWVERARRTRPRQAGDRAQRGARSPAPRAARAGRPGPAEAPPRARLRPRRRGGAISRASGSAATEAPVGSGRPLTASRTSPATRPARAAGVPGHHRQDPRAAVEPVAGDHQRPVGRLIFGEVVEEQAGQRIAARLHRAEPASASR